MSERATPNDFFQVRSRVQTQEPIRVQEPVQVVPLETGAVQFAFEPNTALIVLGLVAIVGLIGLFAVLGSNSKCRT